MMNIKMNYQDVLLAVQNGWFPDDVDGDHGSLYTKAAPPKTAKHFFM